MDQGDLWSDQLVTSCPPRSLFTRAAGSAAIQSTGMAEDFTGLIAAGQLVRVHSLNSKPELNGQHGIAMEFVTQKSRWATSLGGGAPLLLRPDNLCPAGEGMEGMARQLSQTDLRRRAILAATRIREAQALRSATVESREEIIMRLKYDQRIFTVDGIFSEIECAAIIRHVDQASSCRGWDKMRHGKFPTTDLPLDAVPAIEPFLRARIFSKVLRPLSPLYMLDPGFLPEHLEMRDCFFVRYSADEGEQRELEMHTDGSVFSFNILLSPHDAFRGGGTFFETSGVTVKPDAGVAIGHSGQLRHAGAPITEGTRYLLVGFVGSVAKPYTVQQAEWAAYDAFCRFGGAAWNREVFEAPRLLELGTTVFTN